MNKFTIAERADTKEYDESLPVLYKIHIGNKFYLHKGKNLSESLNRLLDDVFRGIRGKQCPPEYLNFVSYCKKYPAVHRVMPEIVLNAPPAKILALEDKMWKQMKNDESCLNALDIAPYKPEWMLREVMQKRCNEDDGGCLHALRGSDDKMHKFKFCPNCGRLNKK